jgi:hypothetical protein
VWAHSLVYNSKRSGDFMLGNQPVRFRIRAKLKAFEAQEGP